MAEKSGKSSIYRTLNYSSIRSKPDGFEGVFFLNLKNLKHILMIIIRLYNPNNN